MTNHWSDIDNSSLVFVMGANPSENHPACMAHVNSARYGSKHAKLIVVDPRKTRTACVADMFVRIRPGTDIAFLNCMIRDIIARVEAGGTDFATNFTAWHNGTNGVVPGTATVQASNGTITAGRAFIDDAYTGGLATTLTATILAGSQYFDGATTYATPFSASLGYPKYCDTRALVDTTTNAGVADYKRVRLTTGAGLVFSNMVEFAATIATANTVFQKLKSHVANYTLAETADICGCTQAEITAVVDEFVANSRMMSSDFGLGLSKPYDSTYKATTILYAMGQTQHTYGSQNIRDLAVLQTIMGNMGRPGGGINALRGIHNVQGSTDMAVLYDGIPGYSNNPAVGQHYHDYSNTLYGNRVVGTGAKDPYLYPGGLGLQQLGFYNMTTQFFGKEYGTKVSGVSLGAAFGPGSAPALIHIPVDAGTAVVKNAGGTVTYTPGTHYTINETSGVISRVAGSTIPYAGTVSVSYSSASVAYTNEAKVFGNATITIPGSNIVSGSVQLTNAAGTVYYGNGIDYTNAAAVVTKLSGTFLNDTEVCLASYYTTADTKRLDADFELLYGLWPKGNGVDHITAFRNMGPAIGTIKAAVVWGQNPAVTEPNQSFVRAGLENLDLLVCVDIFENETAQCKRKPGGVTYLLPACSHVEEAGSVTNSGRWLQWRDRARAPKDNSKADLELLMRFAKQLDLHGAFNHISSTWDSMATKITGSVWDVIYGKHCGTWDGVTATAGSGFEDLTFTDADRGYGTVYGSEAVADSIFHEMTRPTNDLTNGYGGGGTIWIYAGLTSVGGYNYNRAEVAGVAGADGLRPPAWTTYNRAKSRVSFSFPGEALTYPRFGYSWLHNRRVFYNMSEVGHDVGDVYVAPGYLSRVMSFRSNNLNTLADWATSYRAYNTLKDVPSVTGAGTPHAAGIPGPFPAHTEPIETPRRDLAAKYGRNTSAGTALVKPDSNVAMWSSTDLAYADDPVYGSTGAGQHNVGYWNKDAKDYPLVLTTIRCVEHFQGGPITRNNSWNVEAEPVPWVEINSTDARIYGIKDGDWVNITTARGDSHLSQEGITKNEPADWALGFKARVGVGLQSNQRVGPGVVAIPWHWGDKGLSTGSRANDLCIDAWDANTIIPEYKACLCSIAKMI